MGSGGAMRRRRRYRFYLAWLAEIVGIAVIIAIGFGLTALAVRLWAPT
jgi:hypothetical protein